MTENPILCGDEILQLTCWRKFVNEKNHTTNEGSVDSMRTGSTRCGGEIFEGIGACIQYVLSLISRNSFQFDRSEADPVQKLISEFCWPPNLDVDTGRTKVLT